MKKIAYLIILLIAFTIESFAINPVRVSTPVRISTPVRVYTPKVYTPTRISTPVRTYTPVKTVTPVKVTTPVKASTPTYKAPTTATKVPMKNSTPKATPLPKPYKYVGTPTYHHTNNYLLWYLIIYNHNTHQNDTIKAKSKAELDKKADDLKKNNQW